VEGFMTPTNRLNKNKTLTRLQSLNLLAIPETRY